MARMSTVIAMVAMLVAPAFCQTTSNSAAGTGLRFTVGAGGVLLNDQTSSTAAFTAILPNRITSATTGQAQSTSLILGPATVATNTFSNSATASTGRRLSQTTSAASNAGTTFNFVVGPNGLVASNSASATNAFTLRFNGNVLVGTSGRAAQFILAVGPASGGGTTNSASTTTTTGRKLQQNTAANTAAATFAGTFVGVGGAAFVQENSDSGAISIRQPGFVVSAAGSRASVLTVLIGAANGASGSGSASNTQGTAGRKLSQATSAGIGINVNTAATAAAGQFAETFNKVITVSGSISAGGTIPVKFSYAAGAGFGAALVVG